MASNQSNSAIRSVALCDVVSPDVSHLTEQFRLLPEEDISEDAKLEDWSPAHEATQRAEIFQFLRNLEAHRPQQGVFR